jgi:hypothetical protein
LPAAAPSNFVETTAQPVLQFRHRAPDASRKYLIETMGPGFALFNCDNDGRNDAVVAESGGPAHILMNRTETSNDWLTLKHAGHKSNRDCIGSDSRAASIEIHWPGGIVQTLTGVAADRILEVNETQ